MTKALAPGDLIEMVGARFEMVARMGDAENDTVLFRTTMAPGKLVPLHSHIDPECFYVLDGQLDVFIADETRKWHVVMAGKSLLVADGVKHAVRNAGAKAADVILATNNRFARFVGEAGHIVALATPSTPPSTEDIQRMLSASTAFGYWNATPDESAAVTGEKP